VSVDGVRDTAITLREVRKSFGPIEAVRGISLDVYEGEFLTLLGPSGCGKTTTMRMIAGFEEPDGGRIYLRGQDVVGVPPNRRAVNMVFQHYALFPHMSVGDNVAYGLKLKKVPRDERTRQVREMLDIVRLAGMERRRPGQLSGGQQQRVALARALVNRPAALLLDEPLGALDVKLRKQMQLELKRIQHELGTTFVYVTHDQDEALSMSDRIAVMNQGVIEQLASPREIYERPATPFVADFVGVLNAMELRVDEVRDLTATMMIGDGQRVVVPTPSGASVGGTLTAAVRPERVAIRPAAGAENGARDGSRVRGTVALVVYLGTLTQFHVDTALGARLVAHRLSDDAATAVREGDEVVLSWDTDAASVLADESVPADASM
jgi:spermidine/putrescine transport system ATP-binding protein